MYCTDYLPFYKYNYVMENNLPIIIIVIKNLKEVIMLISSPIMPA